MLAPSLLSFVGPRKYTFLTSHEVLYRQFYPLPPPFFLSEKEARTICEQRGTFDRKFADMTSPVFCGNVIISKRRVPCSRP